MPVIVVTNESTVLSDALVHSAAACLQAQVSWDYFPIYGKVAELQFHEKTFALPKGWWQLIFADNSDQAGALGYHETTANGDPIGYVFAKTDIDNGESWTVTASHELLEMLEDPDIQLVEEQDNADGSYTFRSKELCDVCEDDSLAYRKSQADGTYFRLSDGTAFLYSDFVYPAYWNPNTPAGTRLDYGGHITKPLEILPGGYINILQVPKGFQWNQVNARLEPGGKEIYRLSRRARRKTADSMWKRSERVVRSF